MPRPSATAGGPEDQAAPRASALWRRVVERVEKTTAARNVFS
jgi:hypothetical protein